MTWASRRTGSPLRSCAALPALTSVRAEGRHGFVPLATLSALPAHRCCGNLLQQHRLRGMPSKGSRCPRDFLSRRPGKIPATAILKSVPALVLIRRSRRCLAGSPLENFAVASSEKRSNKKINKKPAKGAGPRKHLSESGFPFQDPVQPAALGWGQPDSTSRCRESSKKK